MSSGELEPFGEDEEDALERCERVIEETIRNSVLEIGRALREIRDSRLYRKTHATFEAYLSERWRTSPSRAYRLIKAARIAQLVSPTGDMPLPNERQARELLELEDDDAILAVWEEIVEEARVGRRKITANAVRIKVRRRTSNDTREEEDTVDAFPEAVRPLRAYLRNLTPADFVAVTPSQALSRIELLDELTEKLGSLRNQLVEVAEGQP